MIHSLTYPGTHNHNVPYGRRSEYAIGDLVYVSTTRKQAVIETYNHDAEKYWPNVTVRYDDGILAHIHSWQLSKVVK